jgi:hypothetical protein
MGKNWPILSSKWKEKYCEDCDFFIQSVCRESPNTGVHDGGEEACSKFKPQENGK